jgi:O-methyltransferase
VAALQRWLGRRQLEIVRQRSPMGPAAQQRRSGGRDVPAQAETMVGLARLDNIQSCVTDVVKNGVPGDLIETGVWRGGATILMRAVLRVLDDTTRIVWVADSFRGLPRPSGKFEADEGDQHWSRAELAVSVEEVRANFDRYGLLDKQVRFLEGYFQHTLATAPIERLAVLRLDGDMYESTIVALEVLYPKLSPGGYLIVDDYALEACRRAVTDYRDKNGIDEPITSIDGIGVYWQRTV